MTIETKTLKLLSRRRQRQSYKKRV